MPYKADDAPFVERSVLQNVKRFLCFCYLVTVHNLLSLSTGAFGRPRGYSNLPGNPECDKELLKLLPELKRISLSELDYLFSLRNGLVQMAAEMGIGKGFLNFLERSLATVKLVSSCQICAHLGVTLAFVYRQHTHTWTSALDMYEDDEETLPEEIQRYWACFRAWAQFADLIAYIEACKSQQGK